MTFVPHGKNLVAGDRIESEHSFFSAPVRGVAQRFCAGSPDMVDRACQAAEEAFQTYGYSSRTDRAAFLRAIADEIDARGAEITDVGTAETGLPEARLEGERGRTTGQLRLFAEHILAVDYLDRRHDPALPERTPLPRPDLRMIQRPIGPVAVFGASNFPLAFSTAGGDTASALAAGCPVVVKGHPAHPGTTEIVADAIVAAVTRQGLHSGVFSLVHDGGTEVGASLVQHPLVRAVGFTGSLRGGRALFNLCAARPVPIPFYGELGSVNPMFLLPEALAARGTAIAAGWAGSLTMGVGQFCTNPGVAVLIEGPEADAFAQAAVEALSTLGPQVMLSDGIAAAYQSGRDRMAASADVSELLSSTSEARHGTPHLYRTTGAAWRTNPELAEEVFGPLGLIVTVTDVAEMREIAESLEGQLTCTLHLDRGDTETARDLLPILERKAGRILANGFPTGVEVCNAMVHGGPYPASTSSGHTSVGTLAIRRWLRPVCYQNIPHEILPTEAAD